MVNPMRMTSNEKEIRYYAKKGVKEVRIHLINNPYTPDDVIEELAQSKNEAVAIEAAKRLADPESFLAEIREEIRTQQEQSQQQSNAEAMAAETALVSRMPVTTLASVPGSEISQILGLVHGVGNVAVSVASTTVAFTTAGKAELAMQKAEDDLRAEAKSLQADAVVGVVITSSSAGMSNLNRAQTLQLVGTAVRLTPLLALHPDASELPILGQP